MPAQSGARCTAPSRRPAPVGDRHRSLSGVTLSDTPLLHTGGGRTEIDLDLLFDVNLAGANLPVAEQPSPSTDPQNGDALSRADPPAPPPPDVRDLTRPLWNLTENSADERRGVPVVRFVWGKAWNVLAVVESFAERLESFSSGGVPGRSWVRMRMVRVSDPAPAALDDPTETTGPIPDPIAAREATTLAVHTVIGSGGSDAESGAGGQRLPEIAALHLGGRPWLWRWVADANDLDDVVWPPVGMPLKIPVSPESAPAAEVRREASPEVCRGLGTARPGREAVTVPESVVVPAVRVVLGGYPMDGRWLSSVRVRRESGTPAACELQFTDPDGVELASLAESLVVGAELEVGIGDRPGLLFCGDLLTVEHRFLPGGLHEVIIRGQDRAHRWRQDCRIRAFVDVTVGDVIREVADEVGLDAEIVESGPRWPRFLQDGRSTLDLISDLSERAGLTWQVDADGRRLRVLPIGQGDGSAIGLSYGRELLEANLRLSAVGAHEGWRVTGWDPVSGEVADERSDAGPAADAVGNLSVGDGVVTGSLLVDDEHAASAARALGARTAARARTVRGVALGDLRLVPGARVRLTGLPAVLMGEYVLTSTDHVLDAVAGHVCVFASSPPPSQTSATSRGARTTIAEVLRVDDPQQRGRVTVSLLGLDGLESEWLPVLALGAGSDKGLTCQPDVGDRVLVTYESRDPGRGVVLGTLREDAGPEAAAGVGDGAVGLYALRLPGGQLLRLAADHDEVRLVNAAGSSLVLDADGVRLRSVGDLVIEAPGRRLTLRADAIELERG